MKVKGENIICWHGVIQECSWGCSRVRLEMMMVATPCRQNTHCVSIVMLYNASMASLFACLVFSIVCCWFALVLLTGCHRRTFFLLNERQEKPHVLLFHYSVSALLISPQFDSTQLGSFSTTTEHKLDVGGVVIFTLTQSIFSFFSFFQCIFNVGCVPASWHHLRDLTDLRNFTVPCQAQKRLHLVVWHHIG